MDYNKLIGREPFVINAKDVSYLKNKRVLITGAGGSIGSELSRQMLFGLAQRLYLFDHSENNLYELNRNLTRILSKKKLDTHVEPIVGEIQDTDYINFLIGRLDVDIVFHTAAHKHVDLCERNPVEAVKNNVFGTQNIINACKNFDVPKFVLISSDKAVEPISVYGVTKFLAEELVLREKELHRFLIVRFGNVIGTRGSAIPLFEEQILNNRKVTITDKKVERYFMTIQEAVSLIVKIGDVGKGGNLYIFNMGEPLNIEELARKIMKLHNKEHLEIKYTGLRKGEKLIEKLWADSETLEKTTFSKIFQARKTKYQNVDDVLKDLKPVCFFDTVFPDLYRDKIELRKALNKIIPSIKINWERRY